MHYAKQKDGRSWLFYENSETGKRRIALAALTADDPEPIFNIERIDCSEAEFEEVRRLCDRIGEAQKKFRSKIGIFCEGQTEAKYFVEVRDALDLKDRVSVLGTGGYEPGAYLEEVAKRMLWDRATKRATYAEYWLVFDRDAHEGFHRAYELSTFFPDIHLAFSNPCFEYWAAMHAEAFDGNLPLETEREISRKQTTEALSPTRRRIVTETVLELCASPEQCLEVCKEYFPGYRKGAEGYLRLFGEWTDTAYRRMRKLPPPKDGLGSDIPDLLDRLFKLAGLTTEEGLERLKAAGGGSEKDAPPAEAAKAAEAVEEAPLSPAENAKALLAASEAFLQESKVDSAERLLGAMDIFEAYVRKEILKTPQAQKAFPPLAEETKRVVAQIKASPSADKAAILIATPLKELGDILGNFRKKSGYTFPYKQRLNALNRIEICRSWLLKFLDEAEKSASSAPAEPESTLESEEHEA